MLSHFFFRSRLFILLLSKSPSFPSEGSNFQLLIKKLSQNVTTWADVIYSGCLLQPFQKLGWVNYMFIMSNLKSDILTKHNLKVLLFNHLKVGLRILAWEQPLKSTSLKSQSAFLNELQTVKNRVCTCSNCSSLSLCALSIFAHHVSL